MAGLIDRIKNGYVPAETKLPDYSLYQFLKNNDVRVNEENSDVVNFLRGKGIFITGGTGFLGKLLIEKLSRSCGDIKNIYMLVRAKKGKSSKERMDQLFDDVIFSELAKIRPNFKEKIVGIEGDVGLPNLGINPVDREKLQQNVNIIYHVAATTRFNEHIKKAVNINIKGVQQVIALAKCCPNLVSVVHVSTAYSNCNRKTIKEQFYEPIIPYNKIIEITENNSDEALETMTSEILGNFPNTYSLTKQIAEDVVRNEAMGLPICVYRPSIVISTYQEPLKSWIDNIYGPIGVITASSVGLLRTQWANLESKADTVPADYVTNALIATSYKTAMEKNKKEIPVYNYVSSNKNPFYWKEYKYFLNHFGCPIGTTKAIWHPIYVATRYLYVYWILNFFLHLVPGALMDLAALVIGKKAQMLDAYKKMDTYTMAIGFFATRQWEFEDDNITKLSNFLNETDRKNFQFDLTTFKWSQYYTTLALGIRIYLLKDPLETLEAGRKRFKILYIVHRLTQAVLIGLLLKLAYFLYGVIVG